MSLVLGTNSFVEVTDADTYLADSIRGGTWTDPSTTNTKKEQCLVTAYRMLERASWDGLPTGSQFFPRSGLVDADGNAIDDSVVPQFMKDAQIELGNFFLTDSTIETQINTGSNVSRVKAGSAEVEFFATQTMGTRFPIVVHELIGRYLKSSTELEGPSVSGLDYDSGLESYDLNRGI